MSWDVSRDSVEVDGLFVRCHGVIRFEAYQSFCCCCCHFVVVAHSGLLIFGFEMVKKRLSVALENKMSYCLLHQGRRDQSVSTILHMIDVARHCARRSSGVCFQAKPQHPSHPAPDLSFFGSSHQQHGCTCDRGGCWVWKSVATICICGATIPQGTIPKMVRGYMLSGYRLEVLAGIVIHYHGLWVLTIIAYKLTKTGVWFFVHTEAPSPTKIVVYFRLSFRQ